MALKKILSDYNGQTPSTGLEVEQAFNYNADNVPELILGKNLFNKIDVIDNTNIIDGNPYTFNTVALSGYFAVESNTQYVSTVMTGQGYLAWFTSTHVFISQVTDQTGVMTSPVNAAYARIACLMANKDITQFEKGTVKTSYEAYGLYVSDANISPIFLQKSTMIVNENINIFDKTSITTGYYIDILTGESSIYAGNNVSDYIPVTGLKDYSFTINSNIAFYNASKVFISGQGGQSIATAPSNATFVRTTIPDAYVDTFMVVEGLVTPRTYVAFDAVKLLDGISVHPRSVWYGGKMNCIGDSITFGYGTTIPYHEYVKLDLGLLSVTNYGISGSTITKLNAGDDTNSMSLRYTDMSDDADLIIVFAPANDIGRLIAGNYLIGDAGDNIATTFLGACNILFNGLITKYPTKKIAVIATTNYSNYTYAQESPYINAYIDAAKRHGLPVLDLFNGGSINSWNAAHTALYMPDGLHPNAAGHRRIADRITPFLNSL